MSKSARQRQKWGIRFRILERDGFRCHWCGVPAREAKLVLDHEMPLAADGEDHPRNLVASCEPCNGGKGARVLEKDGDVHGVVISDLPEVTYAAISAASGIAADVAQNDVCFVASVDFPTGPNAVISLQITDRDSATDLVDALRRAADEIEAAL